MKKLRVVLFITLFLILFMSLYLTGNAEGADGVVCLKQYEGEYILTEGGERIYEGDKISDALMAASGKTVYFDNVRIYENVEIHRGNFIFSGKAFFEGESGITVNKEASLSLEIFAGEFSQGEISMMGGELYIKDSILATESECMVYADKSTTSVTVVGDSRLNGKNYDITGYMTLTVCDAYGNTFNQDEALRYRYMGEKTSFHDLFKVKNGEVASVRAYSSAGEERAVYEVSFIGSRAEIYTVQRLNGEPLSPPAPEALTGYEFLGWSRDGEMISNNEAVTSDCVYRAIYRLKAPIASVKSLSFSYDGNDRMLEVIDVYHPLLAYGTISYLWYRGDNFVSEEPRLYVSDVGQSGEYRLVVEFEYDGEVSSFEIEDIMVKISPIELVLDYDDGEFVIVSGNIADGDEPVISEEKIDGKIYAKINDNNYCLKYSPVSFKNNKIWMWALTGIGIALFLLILASYYVFKSAEKDRIVESIGEREQTIREDDRFVKDTGEMNIEKSFFALDKVRADELISDRLARNMIFPGNTVESYGNEFVSVSLGEIDDAFSDGDKIDLNELKNKGICPGNAFKLKIVASGTLSKSFNVFANEFDISAVKMIVLAGGRAIKVKSKKKKRVN